VVGGQWPAIQLIELAARTKINGLTDFHDQASYLTTDH
jgi:hypothetical protein